MYTAEPAHLGNEGRVGVGKGGGRGEVAGQLLAAVVAVVLQEGVLLSQSRVHLQAPAQTAKIRTEQEIRPSLNVQAGMANCRKGASHCYKSAM